MTAKEDFTDHMKKLKAAKDAQPTKKEILKRMRELESELANAYCELEDCEDYTEDDANADVLIFLRTIEWVAKYDANCFGDGIAVTLVPTSPLTNEQKAKMAVYEGGEYHPDNDVMLAIEENGLKIYDEYNGTADVTSKDIEVLGLTIYDDLRGKYDAMYAAMEELVAVSGFDESDLPFTLAEFLDLHDTLGCDR